MPKLSTFYPSTNFSRYFLNCNVVVIVEPCQRLAFNTSFILSTYMWSSFGAFWCNDIEIVV